MQTRLMLGILALSLNAGAALGADTPSSAASRDPAMERYSSAAERQDWAAGVAAMREALAANPSNADYHNLYAYSLRKSGAKEMDLVFKHYNEALRIDPKHRGAHEYIGEAYLMVGNVAKAREHLGALDKICFFPCNEYAELKRAISQHEAKIAK